MLPRLQFSSSSLKSSFKKVGLSIGAMVLGASPIVEITPSAQALPSRSNPNYATTVAQTSTQRTTTQNLNDVRFECQLDNGQYTVMYNPQSQPNQFYPWATPTTLGGGWSPARRCEEISRRLEFYRPDGLLELQTGLENGYNTVCVTTEAVSSCRIVLTVPPGQDPVAIRDRIFNNLLVADSGEQTTAVTAYQGDDSSILNQLGRAIGINVPNGGRRNSPSSIDLRPFLDPADGGTGTQLRNMPAVPAPAAPAQNHRLNPGNFR